MTPNSVGFQDLAALLARQPAVAERWRQHVFASPFGTIHAATFSFPQPIGSLIPATPGYHLASLDPRGLDITGSINPRINPLAEPAPQIQFPEVDRSRKGDLLVPRKKLLPPQPQPEQRQGPLPHPEKTADSASLDRPAGKPALADAEIHEGPLADAAPAQPDAEMRQAETPTADEQVSPADAVAGMDMEFSPFADAQVAEAELLTDEEPDGPDAATARPQPENPAVTMARLYFGADTFGASEPTLKPWREGEAPVLIPLHPSVDPDIKRAAVDPAQADKELKTTPPAREGESTPQPAPGTETIAPKGEVTGAGRRPKTPAERLGLTGAARAKHERCLSNAIYFESRGEPERGQMAVAQVVLNRVFSGYYPDNVCGVVYQNAHRHLACQFTFACDNVRDVVTEPDAWEVAKRIARDSLDGKIWLPEIGKATHYHATYVNPWWVRTMKKHKTLGIHIFYRPTRWGDGAEAPSWGPAASVSPSIAEARL